MQGEYCKQPGDSRRWPVELAKHSGKEEEEEEVSRNLHAAYAIPQVLGMINTNKLKRGTVMKLARGQSQMACEPQHRYSGVAWEVWME